MPQVKIRTIVIDNEALALADIKTELSKFDFIEIIGEASDSKGALRLIEEKEPQLIISDIVLSDRADTIFQVLDKIQERGEVGLPYVVLVSGFAEDYYEDAFNHQSPIISVLHKASITHEKLLMPLNKVQREIAKYPYAVNKRIFTYGDYVYLKYRGGNRSDRPAGEWFVLADNIKYIISEDATVIITFEKKERRVRKNRTNDGKVEELEYFETLDAVARLGYGLGKVSKRLDPRYFIQINPGTIINVKYIENIKFIDGLIEIKMWGRKDYFFLTGDDRVSNFKSYFQFTP